MPKHSWRFSAIGTDWEIDSSKPLSTGLQGLITKHIEAFELQLSRFIETSLVSNLHSTLGPITFDSSLVPLFELYESLETLTDGQMTPTVGSVLAAAGYDARYSLTPQSYIPPAIRYTDVVRRSGSTLSLNQPVMLDFGAAGKGLLVDQLTEILIQHGHSEMTVDGSGDIRRHAPSGKSTERIGLEHPKDPSQIIGVVELGNGALCASGSSRRAWGKWHHIVNAVDATPTRSVVATWVMADSAMLADGLATALFFCSPEKLSARYTYEYLRVLADGTLECSPYFAKGVFS